VELVRDTGIVSAGSSGYQEVLGVPLFRTELTTVLTTTMTTVGLPYTLNYATVELASCPVMPSARAYGSEGWEFESLRARSQ